jgi:deoxyribodipyrimidine photo-lyase
MFVRPERTRQLNQEAYSSGPIVYWMTRDARAHDNWSLLYALELAKTHHTHVVVAFCVVPTFLGATWRQYHFMLEGLKEVEAELRSKHVPFHLLLGDPGVAVPKFLNKIKAGAVVTDFSPLRIFTQWKKMVGRGLDIPFYEVDAHNIVPCWKASPKLEFAARTFRPKINALLSTYLEEFPTVAKQALEAKALPGPTNWAKVEKSLTVNRAIGPVTWITPGAKSAKAQLRRFIEKKLSNYDTDRNDPTLDGQSNLSPYLHFGQISSARIALEIKKKVPSGPSSASYLEELIVRRELSDNFCFYNSLYDQTAGFPEWAQKTLAKHRRDERDYVYTRKEFEQARTHDPLWNAAQSELLATGKMHGYMRMYWAKKILEWTATPEEALAIAIYLNDTYELDGRDPNGYVGVAWSIGGVHDRAWFERSVFGTIRYMNDNGAKRKFDVPGYIAKWSNQTKLV